MDALADIVTGILSNVATRVLEDLVSGMLEDVIAGKLKRTPKVPREDLPSESFAIHVFQPIDQAPEKSFPVADDDSWSRPSILREEQEEKEERPV